MEIPRGHKIALGGIAEGEQIIKYGFPVGKATRQISAGEWVHTHNTEMRLHEDIEYCYQPVSAHLSSPESSLRPGGGVFDTPAFRERTFLGFPRGAGRAGTRNEIW